MTRVFHINSNYLTSKLHENLVGKLEKRDIENTVYMPIKEEKKDEFLYSSSYNVHFPVTFNDRDKYLYSFKQRKIMQKLEETFDMKDYDICHAHTLFTDGNVAYQLNKKYGIPYVVTVRGHTDIELFFKKRINLRNRGRKILQHASKIIFMSEPHKLEVFQNYLKGNLEDYNNKTVIMPNGIDDFWFENEGAPKTLLSEGPLRLLYVGKINKTKNSLKIVDTMRVLENKYNKKVSLTVVGSPEDKTVYEKLTSFTDMNINIEPQTNRDNLKEIYRNHDIFIMPSFTETFGLVYAEALSQGLPVIYTKGQGFDGHFDEGKVGYAVDPRDEMDIAEKVVKIMDNYENVSSQGLICYKKFNWDRLADQYKRMYIEESNSQTKL